MRALRDQDAAAPVTVPLERIAELAASKAVQVDPAAALAEWIRGRETADGRLE